MKFSRILTLAVAVLALPAWAANLTVADNIELSVVNGKTYKAPAKLFGRADKIELEPGQQQVVFRIFDNIRSGSAQNLFRSEYYVITFDDRADDELKLAAAPISNMAAARQFDSNPSFTLVNQQEQAVPFEMAQLRKAGMQVSRDLVNELREFNATGHKAAIESRAPFAALALMNNDSTVLPEGNSVQQRMGDVLLSEQMLHYWFQQADHSTRERFLGWAERSMKKTAESQ